MVTLSSGVCALAADRAAAVGAPLPSLARSTASALAALVPQSGAAGNPFDATTAAIIDPGLFERVVTTIGTDPAIGLVAVVLDPPEERGGLAHDAMKRLGAVSAQAETGVVLMSTTVHPVSDAKRAITDEAGLVHLGCGLDHGLAAIAHAFRHASRLALAPRRQRRALRVSSGGALVSGTRALDDLRRAGVPVLHRSGAHTASASTQRAALEVVVHVMRDARWGPALAVWAGVDGITAWLGPGVRLLPLSAADASDMLSELADGRSPQHRSIFSADAAERLVDTIVRIGDAALRSGSSPDSIRLRLSCAAGGTIEALDVLGD